MPRARHAVWSRLIALAVVLAAALAACGVVDDTGRGLYVRATWQEARGVIGHRVHVVEKQVACSACHDLSGKEIDRPTARSCVAACHEKEAKIEHAREQAEAHLGAGAPSDCLQCHAFVPGADHAAELDPWDCMRCHQTAQDDTPAVVIHKKSTCDSCHQPHGERQIEPSECNTCHDDISTTHAADGHTPAEVCATCHQNQHEEAKNARDACQPCHATQKPIIPKTALFEGHTECTGCHRPHDYEKAKAVACRKCHEETPVLGGGKIAAHATCNNCHDAHDVQGGITRACVSCHDEKSTSHPKPKAGEVCSACHDPHPPAGQTSPARACSNCHHAAATDSAFHGQDCKACHEPHQFVLTAAAGAAPGTGHNGLCKKCHAAPVAAAQKIDKHAVCSSCHGGLPHRPVTTNNCASCHATVASRLPIEHNPCGSCHEPHGGGIAKSCGSCHTAELAQAPAGHRTCTSCHDQHAATAVKACTTCHVKNLTAPHASLKGGCATCHTAHDKKGVTFAASCESCHQVAKLPGLHQTPKHQRCASCHAAHGKAYTDERVGCTSPCHLDMQNHKPEAPRCATCHLFR